MQETTPVPVNATAIPVPALTQPTAPSNPEVAPAKPAAKRSAVKRVPVKAPPAATPKPTAVTSSVLKDKPKAPSKAVAAPQAAVAKKATPSKREAGVVAAKAAVGQPVKPGKAAAAEKVDKTKKPKLVRDSFTIPKTEYQALEQLKARSVSLARPMKKSELLRAGLMALGRMNNSDFLAALALVPTIKTGRPKTKAE